MFDPTKLIIIAVVAFLFFGPDKLPEIARTVGKFIREFKKVQEEMETTIRSEMYTVDLKPHENAMIPGAQASAAASETSEPAPAGMGSGWAEEHEEESEE